MTPLLDLDAIRREVRALEFERGTPADVAEWREADARWLRLLVAQAVTDIARYPARPERPVLFLLDEFAALVRLEPVERAMGLMAGYGLQLWSILQDMHQLRARSMGAGERMVENVRSHDCHPRRWPSLLLRWPRDQRSH